VSLKSTGLCSCLKELRVTIITAIQTYGIWPLPRNFCVCAEFREIPRKHGNSAATAKFRGSARNSAAHGKLWALIIMHTLQWARCGYIVCLFVFKFVCVCVFVQLRIYPPSIKLATSNFARWIIGVLGRESQIFVNFGPPEAQNWTNWRARTLNYKQNWKEPRLVCRPRLTIYSTVEMC